MRLTIIPATDVSESPVLIGKHTPAYSLNFVVSHFAVDDDVVVVVPLPDPQHIVLPSVFAEHVALVPRFDPLFGHAPLTGVWQVPDPPEAHGSVVDPEVLQYFVPVGQATNEHVASSPLVQLTAHCVLKFGQLPTNELGIQAFSAHFNSVLQALVTSCCVPQEDMHVTSQHAAETERTPREKASPVITKDSASNFKRNIFFICKKNISLRKKSFVKTAFQHSATYRLPKPPHTRRVPR